MVVYSLLKRLVSALVAVALVDAQVSSSGFDHADPLIGTGTGGHVFAGATLPFGMAKAVADVNGEDQGGFGADGSSVYGFSHMHDSGTGGSPSLGNFPIFPHAGCPNDDLNQCTWTIDDRSENYDNSSVEAHPGYFALTLANSSIHSEMTVSNHTAIYRFTFPQTPAGNKTTFSPLILLELTDLPRSRLDGAISVNNNTGRIMGNGTFQPSFGVGQYSLSFCADFSGADVRRTGVFRNNRAGTWPKQQRVGNDGVDTFPSVLPAGAFTQFQAPSNNQLLVRVGVSFISPAQACANAEREIPDFDFNKTLTMAEDAWKDKLSTVTVDAEGVDENLQTTFWSGVYRTLISPQDYTGENPLWQSSEPYYDSFYCGWDSFRSVHPLITLLDPDSQALMIRSLIDTYRHEGYLPDCRMSLCKGFTQGGSNADVILTDSYLKGITQGVDWATGYEAIVKDAEIEPSNWDLEGRGGLESWHDLGYIPTDDYDPYGVGTHTRSISRTVEYAYNDFCIAEMAKAFGKVDDYEKYSRRSTNWHNMFKADQSSAINGVDTGYTGFLQPKFANGTWGFQDPAFCSPLLNFTSCYLNPDGHETYEGSCWLYTFFVPGDMASLVTTLGGPQTFSNRLDHLHDSGLLYIGDEQGFLNVFLYHYAGRPGLSSRRAHFYIPSQFNDTLAGIPGNDDSGAMGSFVALTMMGIFPNPGQNVYFITPPFFREVNITSRQTGKVATIRNINFDATYTNIYVASATLNGQPYTKSWLDHSFFLDGGVLELTLGPQESSSWGAGDADLPPSLSTTGIYPGVAQLNGTSPASSNLTNTSSASPLLRRVRDATIRLS